MQIGAKAPTLIGLEIGAKAKAKAKAQQIGARQIGAGQIAAKAKADRCKGKGSDTRVLAGVFKGSRLGT